MNLNTTLIDLADRAEVSVKTLPALTAGQLNAHPLGHPNSIAWLLWHTGRVLDALTSPLTGDEQLWDAEYKAKFGLGALADGTGVGHTTEEAAQITAEDQDLLTDYIVAGLERWRQYVASVENVDEFEEIVGEFKGGPQTRQAKLTLAMVDAVRHIDQALYVAGMPEL
ncbi:DinB family protein [Corynebacterium guangdongense]|uniref:DinB-like domain-containing protein n=1 Tax=Corynebacterium guangdongense TaxID=1783348 RepID=A0ABU2A0I9_9CORY|nr:DinB family protein [Corynebacterium guangdongense]MDR7330671.1 hypothetical protein [Corynebacterium guangdongense]WJZ16687.1 hypothetical protein CGUA_00390 [Corynebacterium guangdongense]